MIRLNMPREPYWLDLGFDVRVKVRPLSTSIMATTRAGAWRKVRDLAQRQIDDREVGADTSHLPDLTDPDVRAGVAEEMVTCELARWAIIEWQGVYAAEGEEVAAITEETVGDLMRAFPIVAERFLHRYTNHVEKLETEGNA